MDLERVYEAIHHAASKLMPAEAFVLSVLNEEGDKINAAYLYDEGKRWPSTTSESDVGLSGKVIGSGEPLLINDLRVTPLPEAIEYGEGDDVLSILAVPLRLRDRVFGMISVQSHLANAYSEEDQVLLDMLGAHATAAIENARLFGETRQRLTELEAVNRISTALRVAQTAEQMLPRLLDETLRIIDCDSGVIWLYNRSTDMLEQVRARGWFSQIHEEPVRPGDGIAGKVFKTGVPIISREFARDEFSKDATRSRIPAGWGGACVPIRTGHDVIGVLFASVPLPRQLDQSDVGLLTTITEIAGNAIQRSNLYEQSQRQLQRLASLRTIDMAINTVLDLRVTLSILIDHLLSQLNVDAVAVFLLNPTTQMLYHGASEGFRTDVIMDGQAYITGGLTSQVARTRSTVFVPDLAEYGAAQRTLAASEGFVSYYGVPLIAKGQVKGVLEIFHRSHLTPDLEWRNFLETLAGQAALAVDNASLFEELQRTNVDLSLAYDATIEGWSKALDLRDRETEGHTQRVAELTLQLAKKLGVDDTDQVHIRRGALLHDIGKMGVPDNILFKAGPLDDVEWEMMRKHPVFAYEMLFPIFYLRPALDIPYGHHEHWDGSGYPRRLKSEQIPLAARIFAVVDVWDALTSDRPYRQAWTKKRAFTYIRENTGTHFDPNIVDVFLNLPL
jgi:putative nucleotidyltransferase with HDIG domain